jgi:uracil-DNA glycosylase
MGEQTCPACKKELVLPHGFQEFPILIVGNSPSEKEGKVPFDGNTTRILSAELGKLGIDLRSCRQTNFWLHKPNTDKKCKKFMEQELTKEAKGKKAILLMGAEPVNFFTGGKYGVKEVTSLRIESETVFSAPIILASLNAAEASRKGVGELRLSLKRFSNALEKEGLP